MPDPTQEQIENRERFIKHSTAEFLALVTPDGEEDENAVADPISEDTPDELV